MSTLLIDADILVYRAISSTEQEIEWEPDVWTIHTDLNDAMESFDESLRDVLDTVGISGYLLCFSDTNNFRKKVYPAYKSNRANTRKPCGFKAFKEKVIEQYRGTIKPNLEGDDCLGILATKNPKSVIYSGDKDLKQIPGQHLVDGKIISIHEEEADRFFYTQVLTGDPTDGYPGCPGIGKVKAEKILDTDDPWKAIVEAYDKTGLTEADALVQARCARILRNTDWDEKKQKVKLWKPNS